MLSKTTSDLLDTLHVFSGGKITRRADLGTLLDLAHQGDENVLLKLCFDAKFAESTFRIIQRIEKGGPAYEKLSGEFLHALERVTSTALLLLAGAPDATREHFSSTYFGSTRSSFANLLALLYDLSWYKNWLIDTKHPSEPPPP